MERVVVTGLASGPFVAHRAVSFGERLLGLRSRQCDGALLIDTNSVHTFGLDPIGVIGIGRDSQVVRAKLLSSNRIVWVRGATRILEVPEGMTLPPVGATIEITHG